MLTEKLILIGCDDTMTSSALQSGTQCVSFPNQVIAATRVSDMISIIKSLDPDLAILSFRNNQTALNDMDTFVQNVGIPLLCLSRDDEHWGLRWPPGKIVFSYQLQHVLKKQLLAAIINSIFSLGTRPLKNDTTSTYAQAAIDANRNLSRYVMELDQKAEILVRVKDRIAELYQRVDDPIRVELTSIVNAIKSASNNHKLWEDFKMYFEQTDPDFLFALAQKYPDLTTIDLKYCCYIKMNMGNDDIGSLLGINQESVRTHKYRLKKKMSLPPGQDLRTYLRSVGE